MPLVALRSLVLAALAAALLHGAAPGQNTYYYAPSDTPTSGTCNVFPWGQSSSRHQHVVTAAELGNNALTINDIAYAACGSGTFSASQILIRMAHVQGATLSSTFATNLGSTPVTVLSATNWTYTYTSNAWADVGLTGSFGYDPALGNLLIDIEFCGASGGGSFHRDVANRVWSNSGPCPSNATGTSAIGALKVRIDSGTGGTYTPSGQGCGNPALSLSGSGIPNVGGTSSIAMGNGPPNMLGVYGANFTSTNVSLTSSGAPGCFAYIQPLVVVATAFDGAGNVVTSFDIPIPNDPGLIGVMIVQQGAAVSPGANALGVVTSNALTTTIGM